MSRLDWKEGGRFDRRREQPQIDAALRGYQNAQIEDEIGYFRYWAEMSQRHPVYDEPTGTGLVFHPQVDVPVLHATHDEGGNQDTETGFYTVDSIYVTASFEQLSRTGLTEADIHTSNYLKDRIFYDGKLFRVHQMHVTGQISEHDFMVSIEGSQLKPDEYILDPQFKDIVAETVPDSPVGPIPEDWVMPVFGAPGPPGASAYDLWVAQGNTGTVQDFLDSLKGAPGNTGTSGGSYHHVQATVSDTWSIQHNLGYNPNVAVYDSAGDSWEGDVAYDSVDHLTIRFSSAFSGVADLS